MKTAKTAIMGITTVFLIAACVMFEDRLARVTTPEIAAAAIAASCAGGRDFIAAASLDETAAAILTQGVETACALRAERKPVSATTYDVPLDQFCAEIVPLKADETDEAIRQTFNTNFAQLCEARS